MAVVLVAASGHGAGSEGGVARSNMTLSRSAWACARVFRFNYSFVRVLVRRYRVQGICLGPCGQPEGLQFA